MKSMLVIVAFLACAASFAEASQEKEEDVVVYSINEEVNQIYGVREEWKATRPGTVAKNYPRRVPFETVQTEDDGLTVVVRNYATRIVERHTFGKAPSALLPGEQTYGTTVISSMDLFLPLAEGVIVISAKAEDGKKEIRYEHLLTQNVRDGDLVKTVPIRIDVTVVYSSDFNFPEKIEKKIVFSGTVKEKRVAEKIR